MKPCHVQQILTKKKYKLGTLQTNYICYDNITTQYIRKLNVCTTSFKQVGEELRVL